MDSLIIAARDQVDQELREEWELNYEIMMKGKRALLSQSLVRREEVDKLVEEAVKKAEQRLRGRLAKELEQTVVGKVKDWLLRCLPYAEQNVVEKVARQMSREAVVVEDDKASARAEPEPPSDCSLSSASPWVPSLLS